MRGGAGEFYRKSLDDGGNILSFAANNLADKYKTVDILIDQDGVWHLGGVPVQPAQLMHRVDVVWNSAHPEYSDTLRQFSIPNISAPRTTHAIGESRKMLREHMKRIDISLPRHLLIPSYQTDFDGDVDDFSFRKAREVFEKFGGPWVVKSYPPERSMGVHVAKTFEDLIRAIKDGASHDASIEVEELVSEKEARVHAVGEFRGEDVYVLPIEKLNPKEKDEVAALVRKLYGHLGAEHYLYAAFYLHPKRGVFLKDLNFLPDLSEDSHLHNAAELIGAKTRNIIEHMLERAK